VAALEAALDAEYRREAPQRRAAEAEAAKRMAELDRLIGGMVKTLIVADKAGNLAAAGPAVEKARRSLGF
jgi:hypothetical protein